MTVRGMNLLAVALALALVVLPGHGTEKKKASRTAPTAKQQAPPNLEFAPACDVLPINFREDGAFQFNNLLQAPDAERLAEYATELAELESANIQQIVEEALGGEGEQDGAMDLFDDGSGWLGVSIAEVTAEKAKELKLPAERGALVKSVDEDSPAAKAGLKAGDVITEFNGQRVEGTVQFRRMVREMPPGRSVSITIWRDARSQMLSAQLSARRGGHGFVVHRAGPGDFGFHMEIPSVEIPPFDGFPGFRTPRIGIDVENLSGQLGSYFGAPEGEGILVREVRPGSPAEKAGLKAGDVITKVDGERVKTVSDLRAQLRAKREKKTVGLSVIRKGAELNLNVEITQTEAPHVNRRVVV